jgi:RNA polymerase sigma factor (sigma-70 family)
MRTGGYEWADVERTRLMERPQDWADSVVVDRLRRGDSSALAEVYDAYAGLVHGLALRVLGDRRAAEDVTQQVFVELWEAPARFDGSRGTLRGLLATMAHRRAVEVLRHSGAKATFAPDARHTPDSPHPTDPVVVRGFDSERVRDAVARLPVAQRRALELTYFRGRTYRQVAEEMGIPEATAKSRLRLGLQGITETLRGERSRQWA